jgi:glycosyltransferase involved in cell wall biosynthesis
MELEKKINIVAVIMTYNEAHHIERCVMSIKNIVDSVVIFDSYSTDGTISIAQKLGCNVYSIKWEGSYALKFNNGLKKLYRNRNLTHIFRLDADEFVLNFHKNNLSDVRIGCAYNVYRNIRFTGSDVFRGKGLPTLRIVPIDTYIESRLMDEHFEYQNSEYQLMLQIIDDNINGTVKYVKKHLIYARKQALDEFFYKTALISKDKMKFVRDWSNWLRKPLVMLKISGQISYSISPIIFRVFIFYIYRILFHSSLFGVIYFFFQTLIYRLYVDFLLIALKLAYRRKGKNIRSKSEIIMHFLCLSKHEVNVLIDDLRY